MVTVLYWVRRTWTSLSRFLQRQNQVKKWPVSVIRSASSKTDNFAKRL